MFAQQWLYLTFEYFVKSALEFCKVSIKLLGNHSKASRTYFLITSCCHQQPLHSLILILQSNYDAYCHSLSTSTIDLHVDSAGILGCQASSLVILVVPVDLCILCVRSSVCKHVMSCIGVGYSLISVHSYTNCCIQQTQRCSCSVNNSLKYKLSCNHVL